MVLNDHELDDLVAILTLCAVLAVVDSFARLVQSFLSFISRISVSCFWNDGRYGEYRIIVNMYDVAGRDLR
jgi:hypothetical protein